MFIEVYQMQDLGYIVLLVIPHPVQTISVSLQQAIMKGRPQQIPVVNRRQTHHFIAVIPIVCFFSFDVTLPQN
jgi:hypothetical protein